jgi:hypothetical protein
MERETYNCGLDASITLEMSGGRLLGKDTARVTLADSALSLAFIAFSIAYTGAAWLLFALHGMTAVIMMSHQLSAVESVVGRGLGPEVLFWKFIGYVWGAAEPFFWLIVHASLVSFIDHWCAIVTLVVAMYIVSAVLIWKSYTGTFQWNTAGEGA